MDLREKERIGNRSREKGYLGRMDVLTRKNPFFKRNSVLTK